MGGISAIFFSVKVEEWIFCKHSPFAELVPAYAITSREIIAMLAVIRATEGRGVHVEITVAMVTSYSSCILQ